VGIILFHLAYLGFKGLGKPLFYTVSGTTKGAL
jgi:hypothetical protein